MPEWVKQSTGTTIIVGPFLAAAGTTTVNSLTQFSVSSVGGSANSCKLNQTGTSTSIDVGRWVHAGDGYYMLWMSAATLATVGTAMLTFTSSTPDFLPTWRELVILPANTYDSLIDDSDNLQVHMIETSAGVTISSGVSVGHLNSTALGELAGTTIAGVSRVLVLDGFTTTALGELAGTTIAGVSRILRLASGVSVNNFSSAALGDLAGTTIAGVSRVLLLDGFTSSALGDLAGTTIAGVSRLLTISASAVDDIHDEAVSGTSTQRQLMRGISAVILGKSSGGGGTTVAYRDLADTKNVVEANVDSNGNRTSFDTRDLS